MYVCGRIAGCPARLLILIYEKEDEEGKSEDWLRKSLFLPDLRQSVYNAKRSPQSFARIVLADADKAGGRILRCRLGI